MLAQSFGSGLIEAGCDEAGRGCIAGPVVASAVILPDGYENSLLRDSKKLSEKNRVALRHDIEKNALAWAVGWVDNTEIDSINILKASFLAMHRAIAQLNVQPQLLLIDGNRFTPYNDTPHHCIIKGDDKFLSIAAASILAKTYRDDFMKEKSVQFPHYDWSSNKGYPTKKHRDAVRMHGISPLHRLSFQLLSRGEQTKLF